MAIVETTYLKQIELVCDPETRVLVHVFAERVKLVLKDGVQIAPPDIHRDSFAADSDEGRAILGEALAAAAAGQQQAVAERDAARMGLLQAVAEVETLRSRVVELEGQHAASTPEA